MRIGVFDSGIGGVLILKALVQSLPQYDYEYYGDTKHVPYGDRTEEEIYELTKTGVAHLFERDCQIVILACNTASAETLRKLQDEYLPDTYPERRILGVIAPAAEEIGETSLHNILLLGTKRTVTSGKYDIELHKLDPSRTINLRSLSTPELVPLIESQKLDEAVRFIQEKINERQTEGERVDGVLLACTHYNVLLNQLRTKFPEIQFFGQTEIIPKKLLQYLKRHTEFEQRLSKNGSRNIFLTKHRADYDQYLQDTLAARE